MCGIFGCFNFEEQRIDEQTIFDFAASLRHRGPDAHGWHHDRRAVLGNTRLSILDLSESSNQPFYSDDAKTVVVQNGEIYNYIELREELQKLGAKFSTSGDTEVVLRAFEFWGPKFVERLNGMFAISIYSIEQAKMWLYRDRLGVKPLFISGTPEEGQIWFASEIKALLSTGKSFKPSISAIAQFLALNYVPQPNTIFERVHHLPPGHFACFTKNGDMDITPYWRLDKVNENQQLSEADAKAGILVNLDHSTRIRMRSDAPFGAFLSGGLDSSSVVGMMSLYQDKPINTYSIGFDDPRFDETRFATMAARRFATRHQSKILEHDAAASDWADFIWHCDQPHGDVSFIPTGKVAELAANQVKMVLTGDGGDELFAGYSKYQNFFPDGKFGDLGDNWERQFAVQSGLLHGELASELLIGELAEAFFDIDPYSKLTDAIKSVPHLDPINRVLFAETTTLLPGNNLVKPDRMAMAHSLEVRSPFLDYNFAEFAFSIPGEMKLRNGETKWIYKKAVEPLLGPELTWRKKQMFTVPIGEWFRNSLTTFSREILFDGRLESRGLINIEFLHTMFGQHIAGKKNFTRELRALISLEIWFRIFVDFDVDISTHLPFRKDNRSQ